jgi:AraC-like DNA-binding protein
MENWARYLTPSATHRSLGLVCLGVGVQSTTEPLRGGRVLDCHGAVLLTQGSGVLEAPSTGEPIGMVAPSLLWLRPGTPHSYGPNTAAGWTESWLLFDGPATIGYEALGYLPAGVAVQPIHDPVALVLVLKRLADTCKKTGTDVDVVAASLVHEFVVTSKRVVNQSGSQDARLLDGLRAEALSDLSVGERAGRLGVSTRQLRTAVRRFAGCSPTELVDRVRINRAKSLLVETNLPVTEVARAVGFGDPAYFSRHFRAHAGLSPRAFRTQQQQFLR